MQYEQAVQEARRLVKRSEEDQWRLAQLTWEQVENGISRVRWARDTGLSDTWVGVLYRVWDAWGSKALEDRPSFSEAWRPHLNVAREAEGGQEIGRAKATIRNLSPERKAEVASELVRDLPYEERGQIMRELVAEPKVADTVMRDPHTRRQISDARDRIVQEIEGAARDREHADPVGRAVREATLALEIENDISSARWKLAEATRKLTDLADRDPDRIAKFGRALDEVDVVRDWLRTLIDGGTVSDEELAKLLEGGAS